MIYARQHVNPHMANHWPAAAVTPAEGLAGYLYVDKGRIDKAGLGEPSPGSVGESQAVLNADAGKAPWQKFYAHLAVFSGKYDGKVWTNEHIYDARPLTSGKDVFDALGALKAAGLGTVDATTIADWLGNNVDVDLPYAANPITFGMLSGPTIQANALLNPDYLVSKQTGLNVEDALLKLKKLSPCVHAWAVTKVRARAFKEAPLSIANAYQPLTKAAAKIGVAVGDVASGAVDLVGVAGKLAKDAVAAAGNIGAQVGAIAKYAVPITLGLGALYLLVLYKRSRLAR